MTSEILDVSLAHDTFVLERDLPFPPEEVFAAYRDPGRRAQWAAPPGDGMEILESGFEPAGTDRFRCGPVGNLHIEGTVVYLDIVDGRRIIFAERVADGGRPIAMSLVTWLLEPSETGTHLVLLTQVTSLVGDEMVEGSRNGRDISLDNLEQHLSAH